MNTPRSAVPTLNDVDDKRFDTLDRVTLTHPIETESGTLPRGSSGTIVYAYDNGRACEVEFERPFHVVATLEAGEFASRAMTGPWGALTGGGAAIISG